MIDFARDGKPMPDWAHAGYRESGIPEHVEVVWKRKELGNPASPGDWAYDPPYPWDEGEEPAWSAPDYVMAVPPMPGPRELDESGGMHSKFGGVISYKEQQLTATMLPAMALSSLRQRAGRKRMCRTGANLSLVASKMWTALSSLARTPCRKDEERFGMNVQFTKRHKPPKPTKIMRTIYCLTDPKFTPMQKALSWAKETQHGVQHQNRWNEVAAALGADNGYTPMSLGLRCANCGSGSTVTPAGRWRWMLCPW